MIEDTFQRYVEGISPFDLEAMWRKAYSSGYTQRPDASLQGVMSGLEIALWDIIGKATGRPVYELLGGKVHEKLRSYTYIYPDASKGQDSSIYWNAEASAERAAYYAGLGFTGIKFDPAAPYSAFDPRQPSLELMELCRKFCKLIREAVGNKADLLFGTHGQFTTSGPSVLPGMCLNLTTRCGSRNRHRPKSRKRWLSLHVEHRCPSRQANASSPNMNLPACWNAEPRRSCKWHWVAWAASWKPRRSRAWRKPITRRSRRTCMRARLRRSPTSIMQRRCPTS